MSVMRGDRARRKRPRVGWRLSTGGIEFCYVSTSMRVQRSAIVFTIGLASSLVTVRSRSQLWASLVGPFIEMDHATWRAHINYGTVSGLAGPRR